MGDKAARHNAYDIPPTPKQEEPGFLFFQDLSVICQQSDRQS
ncbi:MAG: hypothetical protein ACO31I_01805 [Prochlorotrichaceae cyanobacterium]